MLSSEFPIKTICKMMRVSRSGYYKWKRRKLSARALGRAKMLDIVKRTFEAHRTHGYRWMTAYLRENHGISVSENFIYKCYKFLGFHAQTKHRRRSAPRKIKDRYPNLIFSTWETVDRPRQVIVSDMTALSFSNHYFEVTFYFDVFTKEILSWKLANQRGDRNQYIDGLLDVVELLKGEAEPTILHTDQGSVYASMAYNDIIKDTMIERSMSRAGKPTDNPVNESLNGWIKEELYLDFDLMGCDSREDVIATIDKYVKFYNEKRPCFALNYDIPIRFRDKFYSGMMDLKDTFSKRELSETPKFVQKKIEAHKKNL